MTGEDYHYLAQSNQAATFDRCARHVASSKVDFFRAASIEFVMV